METLNDTTLNELFGKSVTLKGRVLGYNRTSKKLRLDKCFILKSPGA